MVRSGVGKENDMNTQEIRSWFEISQGGFNGLLWTVRGASIEEAHELAGAEHERFEGAIQLPCLLSVIQVFDNEPIESAALEIVRDAARALGRDTSSFRDKCWRKHQREKLRKSFNFDLLEFASKI